MFRSKSIHFYTTRLDVEPIIRAVETRKALKYSEAGMFDEYERQSYSSGCDLPNLGVAQAGDSNLDAFWLITDAEWEVQVTTVPQRRGGVRYGIDPELNPESVVLWPGGVYQDSCVIAGQLATAMHNETSLELFELFAKEFRHRFKRIKSYLVGPEAEKLLDAAYRLTSGIGTIKECDLRKD